MPENPEIYGFEARVYDAIMAVASFGTYFRFVDRAVEAMQLKPGQRVLELGVGTGINAVRIARKIGPTGEFIGLDVSDDMMASAKRKLRPWPNAKLIKARAEHPWPVDGKFDLILISFVFHGLSREQKQGVVQNVKQGLKPDGFFAILDYNQFDPDTGFLPVRFLINRIECPRAREFVQMDLRAYLMKQGFTHFKEHTFYWNYIRLMLTGL